MIALEESRSVKLQNHSIFTPSRSPSPLSSLHLPHARRAWLHRHVRLLISLPHVDLLLLRRFRHTEIPLHKHPIRHHRRIHAPRERDEQEAQDMDALGGERGEERPELCGRHEKADLERLCQISHET